MESSIAVFLLRHPAREHVPINPPTSMGTSMYICQTFFTGDMQKHVEHPRWTMAYARNQSAACSLTPHEGGHGVHSIELTQRVVTLTNMGVLSVIFHQWVQHLTH